MNNVYDVCIIGSGPAGLTAALYMLQNGFKTLLITGAEIGGNLQKINNITNYPGFKSINGYELANNMFEQVQQYEDDVTIVMDEVKTISYKDNWEISLFCNENTVQCKSIINAVGLHARTLGLKNENAFINHGISFCALCDGPFCKNKHVAVIGGGNSAVEYATTLAGYCSQVDIFYRGNALKANQTMLKALDKCTNVTVYYGYNVTKLFGENKLTGVEVTYDQDKTKQIDIDCLFYAIGHVKNEIPIYPKENNKAEFGYFEAGDNVEKIHQVITACGSGCEAAVNCMNYLKTV